MDRSEIVEAVVHLASADDAALEPLLPFFLSFASIVCPQKDLLASSLVPCLSVSVSVPLSEQLDCSVLCVLPNKGSRGGNPSGLQWTLFLFLSISIECALICPHSRCMSNKWIVAICLVGKTVKYLAGKI